MNIINKISILRTKIYMCLVFHIYVFIIKKLSIKLNIISLTLLLIIIDLKHF